MPPKNYILKIHCSFFILLYALYLIIYEFANNYLKQKCVLKIRHLAFILIVAFGNRLLKNSVVCCVLEKEVNSKRHTLTTDLNGIISS